MKYEIEATIPVVQYGNIKPKFTIEEPHEADLAIDTISCLWRKYGEQPLPDKDVGEKVLSFTGEELLYDEVSHTYMDMDGNKLLSGSAYADRVSPKFDKEVLLPKTSKAWGVKEGVLEHIWELNSKISTDYGSAIHNALELYHRYDKEGNKIQEKKELEENYVLPKNSYLNGIVSEFVDKFGTDAEVEVLVSDIKNGRAGRIDRLTILDKDKKVCRVGDYKTNNEMDDKKQLKYQHQLSFYAHILMAHGWTVDGLDIYHHSSEGWIKLERPVLDLTS